MYYDLVNLSIRCPTAIQGKTIETYEKIQLLIMECTFANHLSIDEPVSVSYSYNRSYYSSSGSCYGNKCEQLVKIYAIIA